MTITPDKYKEYLKKEKQRLKEKYGDEWEIDVPYLMNDLLYSAPDRFNNATPEKLKKEVKELIVKTHSFYMYGDVGTGKTFSAYAIARLLRINKVSVKVLSYINMLDMIKSSFKYSDNEDYVEKLLFGDDVLILDDLGSEKATDWSVEILYKLINKRYENMMDLILVSNHSIKELSEKYGDRITSRIIAIVNDVKIKFTGKDRRITK